MSRAKVCQLITATIGERDHMVHRKVISTVTPTQMAGSPIHLPNVGAEPLPSPTGRSSSHEIRVSPTSPPDPKLPSYSRPPMTMARLRPARPEDVGWRKPLIVIVDYDYLGRSERGRSGAT
jgi:hypothetical protein